MEIDQMIAQAEKLSLDYDGDTPNKMTKRYGCYRTTVIDGGFAFKLSLKKDGEDCNRSEWDFYAMTTDDVRELLAKPRYISRNGKVIVFDCLTMREDLGKYDSETRIEFDRGARRADPILATAVYKTHGVSIRDLHEGNFGRDDGTDTIVCTDYGSLAFIATISNEDGFGRFYNRDVLHQMISG
tara:strand:- start:454 stop:1005 length:552 start_codon:yes stop_codon:yes gene_type:complete